MRVRRTSTLLIALAVAACNSTTRPTSFTGGPTARLSNQTSVAVTLTANGAAVIVIPAGVVEDPLPVSLPARGWAIVVKGPSGRTLMTVDVPAGDLGEGLRATSPNLACGTIYFTVAASLPVGGPTFSRGPGQSPC